MKYKKPIYTIAFLLTLFILLIILISAPATIKIDGSISRFIYDSLDNDVITQIFLLITNYTIGTVYGALAVALFLFIKKLYTHTIVFLGFGISSFLIVSLIKNIIRRERPYEILSNVHYLSSKLPHELSFPSGHTTLAFFIAFYLTHALKLDAFKTTLIYSLAVVVGISRIYLGAHFFFDVLGGALLGTIIGIISITLYNRYFTETSGVDEFDSLKMKLNKIIQSKSQN